MVGYIGMVVILQGHHIGHKCVHRDPKGLQQISFLQKRISTKVTFSDNSGYLCLASFSVSYLEDGKHYAAEGSVIGELCHMKDIKAPLVQVVQLLKAQQQHANTSTHKKLCDKITEFTTGVWNVAFMMYSSGENSWKNLPLILTCKV